MNDSRPLRAWLAVAAFALSSTAAPAHGPPVQASCATRTVGPYGFQCHGWATVNPAVGLEPVTFVGAVAGSPAGVFEGRGVFNSSFGRTPQRFIGQATFENRTCAGNITYRVFVLLPDGSDGPELPPLYIDFATVRGGKEILGVPSNAAPGAAGPAVARMNCRLVEVH